MRVMILFNPISGAGRAAAAADYAAHALKLAGHDARIASTLTADPLTWLDPLLKDVQLLVVVGGDGAVRLACGSASRTQTPLYHLPYGTENLFAREFGMNRAAQTLLRAIERFRVEHLDLGIANGRPFLLMASVGFDAEVVHDLAERRGRAISRLSYIPPLLRQLSAWKPSHLSIEVDGRRIDDDLPGGVFVANCRQYCWRLDPAYKACMTDGLLDVVFFPMRSRLELLRWGVACTTRWHKSSGRTIYHLGRHVVIRADQPHRYQLDGDAPGKAPANAKAPQDGGETLPLTVELVPAALPVLRVD